MEKPVVVASFSFPHEAQIARASLESAGIPAIVADEHTINMQWLYSNALGGVKVLVPSEFVEEAQSILDSDFSAEVEAEFGADSIACPSCGGENVAPFTRGKRPAFVVFLLLGFPLFFYQHGLKCGDCGRFWKT
jgi:hypothetical protein